MTSVTHTSSRALALVGLILALAAAAPPALAGTDQNGPLDPWAYALVHRSATETQQYGPLDPWAYAAVHRRDFAATSSAVPEITVMPRLTSGNGRGIDWGSAGVGAAGAFGLVILLAGGTILVRKRTALPRPRF